MIAFLQHVGGCFRRPAFPKNNGLLHYTVATKARMGNCGERNPSNETVIDPSIRALRLGHQVAKDTKLAVVVQDCSNAL